MSSHILLEPTEEDALHSIRLLGPEDKLYKRLSKRLLAPTAPISSPPQAPPTPPPDSEVIDEAAAIRAKETQKQAQELKEWRDDVLIDFAGYESNLARVQFLFRSNELERMRYAAEKEKISETASNVREGNARLHQQLGEAKQTLSTRKEYDVLAEEITQNSTLRPRGAQKDAIAKLEGEIADLEKDCEEYEKRRAQRREQFGKVVDEGSILLALIRNEKESDQREASIMEDEEGTETPRKVASRASTPKIGAEGSAQAVNKIHQSLKASDGNATMSTPMTSRTPSPAPSAKGAEEDTIMDLTPIRLEDGEEEEKADLAAQYGMDLG